MTNQISNRDSHAFRSLLRRKITIPDPVPGYVHRTELVERAMPTNHRLTMISATAGFGKTTLLAECCRTLQQQGVRVAWISLDERDKAPVLDMYIAFACHQAGLNLDEIPVTDDLQAPPRNRAELIIQALQTSNDPLVIAFDEIEHLQDPRSVALLDFLLRHGPTNLHLAYAGREIPKGLSVADVLLSGNTATIDTEDLRFSDSEVARFFELRLSHKELAREIRDSSGWPFALRVSRNRTRLGIPSDSSNTGRFTENWIESRLLSGLPAKDRGFTLDLSLFDWIETSLVDEVLKRSDTLRRIESLNVFEGLLEQVSTGGKRLWQLHKLVREHCVNEQYEEHQERFTRIHRRIAIALSKRNETLLAMHHAIACGDQVLAGEILENAGGIRIWAAQGLTELLEADRLLTDEVVSERPRLQLVRCIGLVMSGRPYDAQVLFRQCRNARDEQRTDSKEPEYVVDEAYTQFAMALYGGAPFGSEWLNEERLNEVERNVLDRLDPATRGSLDYLRCVNHSLKAEFEIALHELNSVRDLLHDTHYVPFYAEILQGQIEFIQGRPAQARLRYERAMRNGKKHLLVDPVTATACQIVRHELAFEISSIPTITKPSSIQEMLRRHGMPFSLFATMCNLLIETRVRSGDLSKAIANVDNLVGFLRGKGFATFTRLLVALRISLLIRSNRIGEAETSWQTEGFSRDPAECVDLSHQSWREMEAVAEARARLLIATDRFDECRNLLEFMANVSEARGLKRTYMRCLALSIVLEQRAGSEEQTVAFLMKYLEFYCECNYAWPLLRESEVCTIVLQQFLDANINNAKLIDAAKTLLTSAQAAVNQRKHKLSERQLDVLRRLPDIRDKQIAAELGLSVDGVRYHLRKIFAELNVADRNSAIAIAQKRGLIEVGSSTMNNGNTD